MTNLGIKRGRSVAILAALFAVAVSPAFAQEGPPAASFDLGILIRDTEALVPLNDWVPLFQFTMSYAADSPAPRVLRELSFRIHGDPLPQDERAYWIGRGGPNQRDILDFAIFREGNPVDERGELDRPDTLLLTFDNTGFPYDQNPAELIYNLDFGELDRQFLTAGPEDGNAYILAVRTSALWHSGQTLTVTVNGARMEHPQGGPVGDDTYPFDDGPVSEDVAYSASFSAWDHTGNLSNGVQVWDEQQNAWVWPQRWYEPLSEHVRPRWDLPGTLFEFVTGEVLNIRQLFSIETWVPIIGLNIHATSQIHFEEPGDLRPTPVIFTQDPEPTALREVNMVFTDIGAKVGDPAGSGGFDPRNQLDRVTYLAEGWVEGNAQFAAGRDFSFNGVWVFHDTNGNGIFDPPTPSGDGIGVTFTDYPMVPDSSSDIGSPGQVDPTLGRWQYIANPPSGADPWWRIKLRLGSGFPSTDLPGAGSSFDGRRRNAGETPTGHLEPTPDTLGLPGDSEETADYFVVFRADSGFQDISGEPGDGIGYVPGADFRAFIEPRWFDPVQGHWQGGVFVDAMIQSHPGFIEGANVIEAWQDDVRWLQDEPWWHQRTTNQDAAKPLRGGVEVHDFVMLYNSNSDFAKITDLNYSFDFESWMDPFGLRRDHFFYGDTIRVEPWGRRIWGTLNGTPFDGDEMRAFQYPFETAPFSDAVFDGPIAGPRSPMYVFPPAQPTLPTYDTWPAMLDPGRYPTIFDWPADQRKARYLKQYITIDSEPVPILGINMTAADDPAVNRINARYLNELYVAFYGPDFTPDDLDELDAEGVSPTSGVQLRTDNGDGTYRGTFAPDPILPLRDLEWQENPEQVDLDGDGVADDLNGDGVVDESDRAWVLRLTPEAPWLVPSTDAASTGSIGGGTGDEGGEGGEDGGTGGGLGGGLGGGTARANPIVTNLYGVQGQAPKSAEDESSEKAQKIAVPGNAGIDLWVTVQTSDNLTRFEWFKAFVPATLPERPQTERDAGILTTPTTRLSKGALEKRNPDEGPVQDYYFHDELPASVPARIVNLAGTGGQTIAAEGELAVLGIDVSTNRGEAGTLAQGTGGVSAPGRFTVASAAWTPNAFAGAFLLDANMRAFEIVSNTANELVLFNQPADSDPDDGVDESVPATGPWRIVKDPTFLEQVIVELYDVNGDGQFNVLQDLKPLDKDQTLSGVAIYRDNDANPANRNGQFDPDIDIPLTLDATPLFVGQSGQAPNQVKFVFSSPGTDDVPVPRAQQPLLRQWVPDTFGDPEDDTNPDNGSEFFIVVRASNRISTGDDFRVAIVTFGPDTPTQPDPDTFVRDNVPLVHRDDHALFVEYPWASRALGFITFFQTPPDNSGYNWLRSTAAVAVQSGPVVGSGGTSSQPGTMTLTLVSPSAVSTEIPAAGATLTLEGTGFGTAPTVTAGNVNLTVTQATDTRIVAQIPGGTTFLAGDIRVTVRNTTTGGQVSATRLLRAVEGAIPPNPTITSISPNRGSSADFPVTIRGSEFNEPQVFFGGTSMPVASWTATEIRVNFPASGIALTGPLDVEVRSNYLLNDEDPLTVSTTRPNGFNYINAPGAARACFIATAAYGTPFEDHLDTFRAFRDGVLLKTSAGTALVDFYYTASPAVADAVAARPWLAATVRLVLTPVAWALEMPVAAAAVVAALAGLAALRRRRTATTP